jgi:hypothetical protein
MDQITQRAFVGAEAVSCVETAGAGAAESAPAKVIEREPVQERRLALNAEVFRQKRTWRPQARGANGNASVTTQRDTAKAAFIGEEKRKKSVRNLP